MERFGVKLLEQNLYRNFTAHLSLLHKMNIVGADTFLRNIVVSCGLYFAMQSTGHPVGCVVENELLAPARRIGFSVGVASAINAMCTKT